MGSSQVGTVYNIIIKVFNIKKKNIKALVSSLSGKKNIKALVSSLSGKGLVIMQFMTYICNNVKLIGSYMIIFFKKMTKGRTKDCSGGQLNHNYHFREGLRFALGGCLAEDNTLWGVLIFQLSKKAEFKSELILRERARGC